MSRHRHQRTFWYRHRILFRVVGVILAISVGLAAAYALSMLGPRTIDPADRTVEQVDPAVAAKLLDESRELEARFVEISSLREPKDEDFELLQQAIAKQEEYNQALGGYNTEAGKRLEGLRTLYQDSVAELDYHEVELAKKKAEGFENEGDIELALRNYRRAAELQKKINNDYPLSSYRDAGRLTQLTRKVNEMRALPIWEASQEAEHLSNQAAEAGNWPEAKRQLDKAISLQAELNQEFRGLRYANIIRLSTLEVSLASLNSSNQYDQIDALAKKGEAALEQKQYKAAAESMNAAARLQTRLNQEHPQSRFASNQRVEVFAMKATDALSREVGDDILSEISELEQSLRNRQVWQAGEIIPGLFEKVDAFRNEYPKSTLLTEETIIKLRFLNYIKDDIALFQDRIYGQLLPIKDAPGWHMARYEVSQALYQSIMLNNPSRHIGPKLPVDSVTWDEANEFCQKVAWIIGLPARLPSEKEFDTGVGSLRYVNLNDITWNSGNSDDETHEVGTKEANAGGFYDLLGNVGEWLSSGSVLVEGKVYVGGGNASDSIDVLADVPVKLNNPRRRNRMRGFRFVANLNPSDDADADTAE